MLYDWWQAGCLGSHHNSLYIWCLLRLGGNEIGTEIELMFNTLLLREAGACFGFLLGGWIASWTFHILCEGKVCNLFVWPGGVRFPFMIAGGIFGFLITYRVDCWIWSEFIWLVGIILGGIIGYLVLSRKSCAFYRLVCRKTCRVIDCISSACRHSPDRER